MDFTNLFEETFKDATKYTCISVKLNWEPDTVPEQLDCAFDYLMDTTKILACSAGKHYEGEHGVPHIHLHFIVERYNKPSNPSQHRNRWLSKDTDRNLDGCSFMYQHMLKDTPRYEFLSYPLKEGHEICSPRYYRFIFPTLMDRMMVQWLKDIGNTIYQKQVALRLRQDKCSEKKVNQLMTLYEIVKNHNPKTYKDMLYYLDEVHIPSLELSDYPDPKNYKSNCEKIAVKMNLLKYSDLIKIF